MQCFSPKLFEISRRIRGLQAVAQRIVIRKPGFITKGSEGFTRGVRVVERRDQRLNHTERAVEGARIAPGF